MDDRPRMTCLQRADAFDKAITRPLYQIRLHFLEHLFFPLFTFTGLPVAIFMVFPMFIWLVSGEDQTVTFLCLVVCVAVYVLIYFG